ncbi:MAG: RNA polymerase factor sigma-54 [Prevotellaceae bacterium]|jgi:RNA polymerase sigma-54 factor|nr:RNA polymerase factor sigma-54 [Prevotellaceae bacterium]
MIRSGQIQIQKQNQLLSPQQMLLVRLLEMPALELEDNVRRELDDNPALEPAAEDAAAASATDEAGEEEQAEYDPAQDYLTADDVPDYELSDRRARKNEEQQLREIPVAENTSFYEQLEEQLNELDLDERRRELTDYLIHTLDNDGRLRKPLDTVAEELSIYADIETTTDELERCLRYIQDFDPPGLGARSLQECLLIQIRRKPAGEQKEVETAIIEQCFDDFTRKHWEKIKARLGLSDERFEQALHDILRLNPRPGSAMSEVVGRNMQQIIPDFVVDSSDGETLTVTLNDRNVPVLRISRSYAELMDAAAKQKLKLTKQRREELTYIRQKVDAARTYIEAVRQRQEMLLKTMQVIVGLQRAFFLEGDPALLRPMVLKDVAERTGMDISTVSRISNSKYVETRFGIYPLKFFFTGSYTDSDGEEQSVCRIKQILSESVAAEDKTKPLTDEELKVILHRSGFPLARRTVAKYRQQLNIPVARLRR